MDLPKPLEKKKKPHFFFNETFTEGERILEVLHTLSSAPSRRAAGLLGAPNWKIRRGKPRANPENRNFCWSAAAWGWRPSTEKSLRANNGEWAEIKHRGCCADNFHIKGDE